MKSSWESDQSDLSYHFIKKIGASFNQLSSDGELLPLNDQNNCVAVAITGAAHDNNQDHEAQIENMTTNMNIDIQGLRQDVEHFPSAEICTDSKCSIVKPPSRRRRGQSSKKNRKRRKSTKRSARKERRKS